MHRLGQHPNAERFDGVTYGKSPAMSALDDLKAWNALPADERAKAIREAIAAGLLNEEEAESSSAPQAK